MNQPNEPDAIFPQTFSPDGASPGARTYLRDPRVQQLVQFFHNKGLAAIKQEDRCEHWYDDWLAYQSERRIYANLIAPRQYSSLGAELNLLKLTRFLEVFGYFSPAHGYSLQCSFLGLFSILMGTNSALKKESVAELERGGLFAFGISEKAHGSDVLANQFTLRQISPGRFVANGTKYYIGNSNVASIISILARKENAGAAGRERRSPLALFAFRPAQCKGFQNARKIHTLGVRAGFVGEFEVNEHLLPESDLIAEGRSAWDAVFGTITLGKFFLGFGQIGICEHALEEATAHLNTRILFGRPAIQMTHLRSLMTQAYARLTAMKLYAYRALDYVQAAGPADRRYLLFTAVQKAKVSTEGVKVMSLLSECMGAKGFESDTYFEMALRDAQLIPGLEGSAHINLSLAAQFTAAYFEKNAKEKLADPVSVFQLGTASENPYLMQAPAGHINDIRFNEFLAPYRPLVSIPNVRLFAKQAAAFKQFVLNSRIDRDSQADTEMTQATGGFLATIAYGQLIAENCAILNIPAQIASAIFHNLVHDLSVSSLAIATLPSLDEVQRRRIRRMIVTPEIRGADWDFVAERVKR
jgi:acyl-CoA dehydrogenase